MAQRKASRAAKVRRPGAGASNAPMRASPSRNSMASGAMPDLDDRAGAQPDQVLRWIFQLHAHGKAVRNPHPVELWFYIGHRAWQVDAILGQHACADAIDHALDRLAAIDHGK